MSVSDDVTLDLSHSSLAFKKAKVQGAGPLVGFVLSDNVGFVNGGLTIYAIQLGLGFYDPAGARIWTGGIEKVDVPAGVYSLYLLGQGSNQVAATLPFEGRPGVTSITAARSVPYSMDVLQNRAPDPAGNDQWGLVSIGRSSDLGQLGFMAMTAAAPGYPIQLNGTSDYCFYYFIPSDEDTAYYPGCPASYFNNGNGLWVPGWGVGGGFVASAERAGGNAHGWANTNATPNFAVKAVALDVRYDPPAGSESSSSSGSQLGSPVDLRGVTRMGRRGSVASDFLRI